LNITDTFWILLTLDGIRPLLKMRVTLQSIIPLVSWMASTEAFTANSSLGLSRPPSARSLFSAAPLHLSSSASLVVGRYYQLEEMEDREDCTTQVFLSPDGSVAFGRTDGPPHHSATGSWECDEEKSGTFTMVVDRVYKTGLPSKKSTDMGDFTFVVSRRFRGGVERVGERVAVEGRMERTDNGEFLCEVGVFSLIDIGEWADEESAGLGARVQKIR